MSKASVSAACATTRAYHRSLSFIIIVCIIAFAFAARSISFSLAASNWDESVYIVMAQRWLAGGLPYVAVWDQHPPGLAALLAVVQSFIDDPILGARLAATCSVAITALLIYRFAARFLHQPIAGILGAILYVVCTSRWIALPANTEIFNNTIVTFAAYRLYGAARRAEGGLAAAVGAALALGVGLQIKYVVFPEAVLLCLGYLLLSYRRRREIGAALLAAGLLILAGCAPTAIAVFYFWAHGALLPFLAANIDSNVIYVTMLRPMSEIGRNTASAVTPIIGATLITSYAVARSVALSRARIDVSSPGAWMALWFLATILDICLPLKFFPHYFFAIYPLASLAGGLSACALAGRHAEKRLIGVAVLFITALPSWAVSVSLAAQSRRADGPRIIAALLRADGAKDGDVFMFNYDPVVYALMHVRPPSRYVLTDELAEFSESSGVDDVAELTRVMRTAPRFVVVRAASPGEPVARLLDGIMAQDLAGYRALDRRTYGIDPRPVTVYERNADRDCF